MLSWAPESRRTVLLQGVRLRDSVKVPDAVCQPSWTRRSTAADVPEDREAGTQHVDDRLNNRRIGHLRLRVCRHSGRHGGRIARSASIGSFPKR